MKNNFFFFLSVCGFVFLNVVFVSLPLRFQSSVDSFISGFTLLALTLLFDGASSPLDTIATRW